MSWWLIAWVVWGLIFLAIEIPASLNHTGGDTLSEQVWRWLGIGRPLTGWIRVRRMVLIAGWAILTVHFFWQFV